MVARCHVIGQRKEGFEEGFISFHGGWKRHQRCVCEASANRLGLSTFVPIAPDTSLLASAIQSFATEFTGAITEVIGRDHPVSSLEGADLRASLLNYAHPFMADLPARLVGGLAPIRPQVGSTNTGMGNLHLGVSWCESGIGPCGPTSASTPRDRWFSYCLPFECLAIPLRKPGSGFVGALKKLQQRLLRRGSCSHVVIAQEKFSQLLTVEGFLRTNRGCRQSTRPRIGIRVERRGWETVIAGPEPRTDLFI